jgi:hypothetical protein
MLGLLGALNLGFARAEWVGRQSPGSALAGGKCRARQK